MCVGNLKDLKTGKGKCAFRSFFEIIAFQCQQVETLELCNFEISNSISVLGIIQEFRFPPLHQQSQNRHVQVSVP